MPPIRIILGEILTLTCRHYPWILTACFQFHFIWLSDDWFTVIYPNDKKSVVNLAPGEIQTVGEIRRNVYGQPINRPSHTRIDRPSNPGWKGHLHQLFCLPVTPLPPPLNVTLAAYKDLDLGHQRLVTLWGTPSKSWLWESFVFHKMVLHLRRGMSSVSLDWIDQHKRIDCLALICLCSKSTEIGHGQPYGTHLLHRPIICRLRNTLIVWYMSLQQLSVARLVW